jgi:GT2 family glycosyltransferase
MLLLAIVYAAASAVLFAFGLNGLWLALRHRRQGGLRPTPDVPAPARWPAVTVQLPLYNEPLVVERLIDAAARLDYPGPLEVQVLDDSTDETGRLAAARVAYWQARGCRIVHLRRPDRHGFKAGALAHGLARAAGELVAVFDADFVPGPDFLRHTVPVLCADPGLGLVQARWGHLNADGALLTRVQAALLDTHFVVEQDVRCGAGLLMNFNGTAGLWRRACIEGAGGWQSDTLTEDLDLSYRAQLAGWRFRFLGHLLVPAEIPATAAAWRQQQFRWTKGAAETARKLLGPVWRSALPLRAKLQATLHLGNFAVYPALLAAALLHAPLLVGRALGLGPGDAYFVALAPGIVAFAGVLLTHAAAQRALYPDWWRRLRYEPALLAASLGLAVSNTRGTVEALLGRRSPFVRTPKAGATGGRAALRVPPARAVVWAERGLALYALGGLAALLAVGAWEGVGFQALFAAGFGLLGFHDLTARWPARRGAGLPVETGEGLP